MNLDNLQNESILQHGINDLANLRQIRPMSYTSPSPSFKTMSIESEPGLQALFDLGSRLNPTAQQMYQEIKALGTEADLVLQQKHIAGKELAHAAVAYLFGGVDNHEIEFAVGHEDPIKADQAQRLHEGYAAHLAYLATHGAITPNEDEGLFVAYLTGRVIQRSVTYLTDDGKPTVIAYRDSETQRELEINLLDPKRLVAGA